MKMKDSSLQFEVVTVTPRVAAQWLEKTADHQRRLSKSVMLRYAEQMKAGQWLLTHEAIGFDTTGSLINGMHRLWAVVEAGIPVAFAVIRGVDPATFTVLDTGKRRSPADVLHISGVNTYNENIVAAAARFLRLYELVPHLVWTGTTKMVPNFNTEVLDVVNRHPDIYSAAVLADGLRKPFHIRPSATTAAYTLMLEASSQSDYLEEFHAALISGANLELGDARLTLRNSLNNRATGPAPHGAAASQRLMALFLKAWNAYIKGEPLKVLKFMPSESMPIAVAP